MPRTFICSTATSAAKLLVDDAGKRLAPGKLRQWVRDQERDGVRRAGDVNPLSFPRDGVSSRRALQLSRRAGDVNPLSFPRQ